MFTYCQLSDQFPRVVGTALPGYRHQQRVRLDGLHVAERRAVHPLQERRAQRPHAQQVHPLG